MASKPYDVVLLPDEAVYRNALRLSQTLTDRGVHFTLDGENYFPHLSLYMMQLADENVKEAGTRLEKIAERNRIVHAATKKYHYSHEYVDVEYEKTDELAELQRQVIESLNPIRDGLRQNDEARLRSIEGQERENILKYGYRSVGDEFFPHLTFTRFLTPQEDAVAVFPPKEVFQGEYRKLALMEMADHGTCCRMVSEWELAGT